MADTGFSDAGRSHNDCDLPGRADFLRRALQLCNLFVPTDKGRKAFRRTGPPARQPADFDDLVAGHQCRKSFHPLRWQGVEGHKSGRQALTGRRRQYLSGVRRALKPLHQMDGRPARFTRRNQLR
jgi:hypothetical protein